MDLFSLVALAFGLAAVAPLGAVLLGAAGDSPRVRPSRTHAEPTPVDGADRDLELSVRRRLYGTRGGVRAMPAGGAGGVPDHGLLIQGRYRLLERAGAGGMATVYRARDELLERDVAVKLLAGHLAGDRPYVERFRQEARLCARLSHPNIVAILDAGSRPSEFIVMEYVDGLDVRELLQRHGRLTSAQAVHVVAQVCDALGHAHGRGVVHCDVAPSNILLRRCDGTAKLADFGLASNGDGDELHAGGMLGTPRYVAPEVLSGAEPGPRSDLYCLGVVTYGLLTGPNGLRSDAAGATSPMASAGPRMAPLEVVRPDLPSPLVAVVGQALAPEPECRQESVLEFRDQLIRAQRAAKLVRGPRAALLESARSQLPRAA